MSFLLIGAVVAVFIFCFSVVVIQQCSWPMNTSSYPTQILITVVVTSGGCDAWVFWLLVLLFLVLFFALLLLLFNNVCNQWNILLSQSKIKNCHGDQWWLWYMSFFVIGSVVIVRFSVIVIQKCSWPMKTSSYPDQRLRIFMVTSGDCDTWVFWLLVLLLLLPLFAYVLLLFNNVLDPWTQPLIPIEDK